MCQLDRHAVRATETVMSVTHTHYLLAHSRFTNRDSLTTHDSSLTAATKIHDSVVSNRRRIDARRATSTSRKIFFAFFFSPVSAAAHSVREAPTERVCTSNTKQSRAEQSKAEHSTAEQSKNIAESRNLKFHDSRLKRHKNNRE